MTVYVRDQDADAIIAKDAKIQDAVQGRSIMLWLPGQGVGVSVNICLTFGWMGSVISVYRMVPQLRYMMGWYVLGILAVLSPMSIIWYAILRGHPAARSRMHAFTIATLVVGIVVSAVALVRGDMIAAGLAAAGLAFTFVALRLVAGPSYALLTAFFRAKRAYGEDLPARR